MPKTHHRRWRLTLIAALCLGGLVWVSASRWSGAPPPNSHTSSAAVLDQQMGSLAFDRTPLKEVLASFGKQVGVTINVDWKNVATLGVFPETPISAKLRNIKLSKAMQIILESTRPIQPIGRWWHFELSEDGSIFITTWARYVQLNTVTLVYNVRDLLDPGPVCTTFSHPPAVLHHELAAQVEHLITDTIDPDSWTDIGGTPGAIGEINGLLIVRQTRENHKSLQNLLEQLRETRGIQTRQASANIK